MDRVATLTLNPTIDSSCTADRVFPTHKVRTRAQRHDPGGGGINVARVLARLGCKVEVAYLAGGPTGALLDELLDERGLERHRIAIAGDTRMSLAVFEHDTGKEFRFVPEGPLVTASEWGAALEFCAGLDHGWLVASGSLPRGAPVDYYARLARCAGSHHTRLVLDTSGPALAAALDEGGLFLVKPSQGEFEALIGYKLTGPQAIGDAAMDFVRRGKARHVAVTLGHEGAVLAHAGGVVIRPGACVSVKSATGAGDSFVAGMVHGFLAGEDAAGAFAWGMAAGTAAVLTPGTGLCAPEDVRRLRAAAD
ncbi:MAG: 1-phosphofructokinase family hexose kinase [Sphingomonadales bacterium]|nr:1-phosphofructokinase family hexose kinase [Sphingomonadales bacterium]